MPKSLYQDKTFATYWNDRAGDHGEPFKRYLLDPVMFSLVGSFKDKIVVDLGCGNGYLAPQLLKQDPKRIIMTDISAHNLEYAAQKCDDPRVEFLEQDATKPWSIEPASVDVVYSNMLLNEIEDSAACIRQAFRALGSGGVFVFSVTHPAWDLYIYAQEKAGVPSAKIKELGGYFRRGFAKFIMSGNSRNNPSLKDKYKQEFEVEHYQRPLSDYFEQLVATGFTVKHLLEPELSDELLQHAPRFAEYTDHPVGLIFYCVK